MKYEITYSLKGVNANITFYVTGDNLQDAIEKALCQLISLVTTPSPKYELISTRLIRE